MATTLREGKDPKPRGKKPSPLKPTTSSSSSDKKTNVPNYLKPTISSTTTTGAASASATVHRRHSFDRPPPPSQVQRALHAAPKSTTRSASFGATSKVAAGSSGSGSTRVGSASRGVKGVESGLGRSKSSLVRSSVAKKDVHATTSSSTSLKKKGAPKSVTSESSSVDDIHEKEFHPMGEDDQVVLSEDDIVTVDDHEVQSLPEISEMPSSNDDLGDPTDVIITGTDDFNPEHSDEKIVAVDEHQNTKDETPIGFDHLHEGAWEEHAEHSITAVDQEGIEDPQPQDQNVEIPQEKGEETKKGKVEIIENNEGKDEKEKKEENEEIIKEEIKKPVEEEKVEPETEPEPAPGPAKTKPGSGKKESQVYNDVIAEKTNQLMKSKSNKVLALAGAFETVISLQDKK